MRRPCWQHGPNSQSSQLNLVLRLSMRNGRLHAHLAARVGILSTTVALVAAVLGLLVGEEQAYAVSTLKDKDGGSKKPRKYSSAAHDSTLSCGASPCQIAPIGGCTIWMHSVANLCPGDCDITDPKAMHACLALNSSILPLGFPRPNSAFPENW